MIFAECSHSRGWIINCFNHTNERAIPEWPIKLDVMNETLANNTYLIAIKLSIHSAVIWPEEYRKSLTSGMLEPLNLVRASLFEFHPISVSCCIFWVCFETFWDSPVSAGGKTTESQSTSGRIEFRSYLYRASLGPSNDVMVTPLTKLNWYLGVYFIHGSTCVPAAIKRRFSAH